MSTQPLHYTIQAAAPGTPGAYTPYGAIRDFFHSPDASEIILSGPAETGKTRGILQWLHMKASYYTGASFVIARKRLTDVYSTVLRTYIEKVLCDEYGNTVIPFGGERPSYFHYKATDSRIWVTGLDKPGKVLSGEYDGIYLNQAEEASLVDWETLTTRVTGRAGHIPNPQLIGDCNPGSHTHWIISRARSSLKLIPTTHKDNPTLYHQVPDPRAGELTLQGERTIARLKTLTGSRLLRLFHGLWAPPEGAIFDVYDDDKHKVVPFEIPYNWPRFVGIDPLGAYVCALWLAVDPQTLNVFVYREYYAPFGITTPDHAAGILKAGHAENVFAYVGGAKSERQQRADFQGAGIPLMEPPISDVWAGIDKIQQLLRADRLYIFDSCVNLISEVGDYRRRLKDGQPTGDIADKSDYHALDALRYIVAWLTTPTETTQVVYMPLSITDTY